MKVLNVGGYEIIYDEKDKKSVKEANVIFKNFFFFQSVIDGKKIYCDGSYLDIFEIIIKNTLSNDEFMKTITNFKLLRDIYFIKLSEKEKFDYTSQNNLPKELINLSVAYLYYNGDSDKIISFLENNKDEEKMFDWFQRNKRLDVYNSILGDLNECFERYEPSIINNYDYILDTLLKEMKDELEGEEEDREVDMKLLSRDDVDKLFIRFLDEIKAPNDWKEKYQKVKEEKGLHFTKNGISQYIDNGKKNIILRDYENGEMFFSLVHEFTHYMGCEYFNVLNEFPAIYFEKKAIKFLIDNSLISDDYDFGRRYNNYEIIDDMTRLFNDLCASYNGQYVDGEEEYLITKDKVKEKEEFISDIALKMLNFQDEDGAYPFRNNIEVKKLLEKDKIDCWAMVHKRMDDTIKYSLQNGIDVISNYSYLLGSYLTEKIIDKNDEDMDQKMFYLATHLDEFNLDNIHEYLGIEKSHNKSLKK